MNIFGRLFSASKQRMVERARAQRAVHQREAETELLGDDIRSGFARQTAVDKFAERDEYKSAIGEDFLDDL